MNQSSDRARRAIFERIRLAQRRGPESHDARLATVAQYLERHPRGPGPAAYADPVQRFTDEATQLSVSVERLATRAEVPAACARFLDAQAVSRHVVHWRELDDLDWAAASIVAESRAPRDSDLAGATGAFCAVAETGTLLLLSAPGAPATAHLLPETHVAVLARSRIVATIEDAFDLVRRERGELPRATMFVSGPSRTADIEQTLVLGAHGPYRTLVLILDDA